MEQAPFPETTVSKCTRPGNAEKQPGQILFDTGIIHKCHTKAEKAADDQHCLEAKAAIQKAVDKGIECLALIEMETEAKENEAKAKKAAPPPHLNLTCTPTRKKHPRLVVGREDCFMRETAW